MKSSHLLLIEPDKVLAKVYKQALEDQDWIVTPCASAQAAVFATDQQKPDLIIMELQLIEHSGVEFLYELRSYPEWQQIPIVINSQIPPSEFSSHLSILKDNLKVEHYLYKPQTTLKELIKVIEKYKKVIT